MDSYPTDREIFLTMKRRILPITIVVATSIRFPLRKCWLVIWILIEIRMAGMAMLLIKEETKEKTILFFLFQSFPSITILIIITINWTSMNELTSPHLITALLLAIVCKIGIFPLHGWILKLSKSISWVNNIIIIRIQKVIPLLILVKITLSLKITLIAAISIIALTLILLCCPNRKIFIITSSITHISWIIVRAWKIKITCLVYLAIYSIIITPIIIQFKKFKYKNLTKQENKPKLNQTGLKVSLLRLSGLPPLAGFFLKALVIYFLTAYKTPTKLTISFLIAATGAFYAYIQVLTKILTLKVQAKREKKALSIKNSKIILVWNTMFPLVILIK